MAFAGAFDATRPSARAPSARAYDRKTDAAATRADKLKDYRACVVDAALSPAEALTGASVILSLVTADQALAAARSGALHLAPGALWLDMNSVAPDTKREASQVIEAAGGRYVDIAVMSPAHPARLTAPLLISGPHALEGAAALAALGFSNARVARGPVGAASATKMIRSVLVKGLEALTTECVLAAEIADVRDDVLASLDASWPGMNWGQQADYNLERMMVHGLRRAAEMEEVVKTLDGLGVGGSMSRGAVEWQRTIGALGLTPATTLAGKIQAALGHGREPDA